MRASDYPYFDARFIALAHRGGGLYGPNEGRENTLAAFAEAVALGYRYLETDVHVSADGVLIAFHDDVLDRVTDARGAVKDVDFTTLRQARVGGSEPVPTLDEILDAFPSARINIDIKADGAIEPLVRTIEQHRAHERVCVGSFSPRRIHAFRRRMGTRVATSVGPYGVGWSAKVPLLPRVLNSPGVAFQLPLWHDLGRGASIRTLTPGLIAAAHARGKHVHVWTINDAPVMHDLIDRGVDGIVTDRIDVLKDVLVERGLWE